MNLNKNIRNQAIIFGIILTLLFSSIPFLYLFSYKYQKNLIKEVTAELKSSGNTWTVDDDGSADFNTIQAAIDAASSGDIIKIHPGTYSENIEVYKSLSITSASETEKPIVKPDNIYEPVFEITANEVSISMIEIDGGGGYYGFYLDNVQHCNLFNIVANSYKRNLVYLIESSHNIIRNINFSNGYTLIGSHYSHYNVISENYIKNCQNLFSLSGDHNLITNNFIERTSHIGSIRGSYNEIINNTSYYTNGISIGGASSSFNTIANNEIKRLKDYAVSGVYAGVYIYQGASNNIVKNNKISEFKYGITITTDAYENVIVNNTIVKCSMAAVNLESGYNYIYSNDFVNGFSGLRIKGDSNFNYIYSNNFINSEANAQILVYTWGVTNYWHSPTKIEYYYRDIKYTNYFGNYFDDYDGMDDNNDGLGDSPYNIHSNTYDKDDYPLMIPFQHYRKSLPELNTKEASDITGTAVTLNANIISIGGSIIWKRRFEWGITPSCGEYWTDSTLISLSNEYGFFFRLTDLEPDTTYYFRAWAKNSLGWNKGEAKSFTTLRAPREWIVDDDGSADFNTIQEAIDAATPGDIILVHSGTYVENIKINKIVSIKSTEGYETTIVKAANPDFAVFEIRANHTQITGFTIKDSTSPHSHGKRGTGIYNSHEINVRHTTISDNYITNNYMGIRLHYVGFCLVEGNKIINNYHSGINSYGSKFNEIRNNFIENSLFGILVNGGTYNTIKRNQIDSTESIFYTFGIYLSVASHNLIEDNLCSNSFYGIAIEAKSSNNILEYNKIYSNEVGIRLSSGGHINEDNIIKCNDIYDNHYGLRVYPGNIRNTLIYLNNFNNYFNYYNYNPYGDVYPNSFNSIEKITYSFYGGSFTNYLGNYWSNYVGSDNDPFDGIGDRPHQLTHLEQDNYSLMEPFQEYFDPTEDTTPPETKIEISPWITIDFDDVRFTWNGKDDLTPSYALEFQYKLEGYDEDWSEWTTQNSVTYYDLPYGKYTFWVMARDVAGNEEFTPARRVFFVTREKQSLIYLLNQIKSKMLSILETSIENYAEILMLIKDVNDPDILKIIAELGFNILNVLTDPELLQDLIGMNPFDYFKAWPQVGQAILSTIDGNTNPSLYLKVKGYIKSPGFNGMLFLLNMMLTIINIGYPDVVMGKLRNFNEDLKCIHLLVFSSNVDSTWIKAKLYNLFGNNLVNYIESKFNYLCNYIHSLNIEEGVDQDYLYSILSDIYYELSDIGENQRNLLIVDNNRFEISNLESEKKSIQLACEKLKNNEQLEFKLSLVATSLGIISYVLLPTGAPSAIVQFVNIFANIGTLVMKGYTLSLTHGLFDTVFQASNTLCILDDQFRDSCNSIDTLVREYLSQVTKKSQAKIIDIDPISSWKKTNFEVTIKNEGPESNGFITYHVRDLDQNLILNNWGCFDIQLAEGEIKTENFESPIPFSFWGGSYEVTIELWLDSKKVDEDSHIYYVGVGRNIDKEIISEGTIDNGDTLNFYYDSTENTQSTLILFEYRHCTVNLHVYDNYGNHLGINYITGTIDTEISDAVYSGQLTSKEWVILPPGTYQLQLVSIDVPMEGEPYCLSGISFFSSQGFLDVIPSEIKLTEEPGTTAYTSIILREFSQQYSIADINIEASKLINSEGVEIDIKPNPQTLGLEPGGDAIIELEYSIPIGTPLGIYQGTITITGTEVGNEELLEFVIPISLEVEILFDKTPPETLIEFGDTHFIINDNIHLISTTPIELLPSDLSGISGTFYMVSNDTFDSGWIPYTSIFSLNSLDLHDGDYVLHYYSTDIAGNSEVAKSKSIVLDNSPPELSWEYEGFAFQGGILFDIEALDATEVMEVLVSLREFNGPIVAEIPVEYVGGNLWHAIDIFDSTTVPDGYYELVVDASDALGFLTTEVFSFSIRNWAVLELLPSTESNKAGRTMPIKFALRVVAAVDPNMPFVINQELEIRVLDESNPEEILQTFFYGDTSVDYRIDVQGELYITNFKTSKTPADYVVEIYRKGFFIGSFAFSTVKKL